MMTVNSFFSGIGGMDLGFERAGFRVRWMCEKDEYARQILRKHWPHAEICDDIETCDDPGYADVWTAGFPCQDISNAGAKAGIRGARSGLYWTLWRLVRRFRPRYLVLENVAALAYRGLDAVLGSLAEIGYDAEWQVLSACSFGAPHTRERLFIVAYPHRVGQLQPEGCFTYERRSIGDRCAEAGRRHWATEPRVDRVAHGVPSRLDRERALGNAVVPQVAEYVARCVRAHAEAGYLMR